MLTSQAYADRAAVESYRRNQPLSESEIRHLAPSVYAAEPHDSRSAKYAYIPTMAVLAGLQDEGFQVFTAQQARCRDASRHDYTKHMLRLRHPNAVALTEAHISTITDAILLLRYVEIGGDLRRGISVIKMRGSQHAKSIREFTIDARGMIIGQPFGNVANVLLGGSASPGTPDMEGKHLAEAIEDWHEDHEWSNEAHKR